MTLQVDIATAVLECARADVESETERTQALDSKLTGIASLSGLALSIGASVGATVVVSGDLGHGFIIALGAVLSIASLLLLASAAVALSGLTPKEFQSLSLDSAKERVSDARLSGDPADAIAELAATYYVQMLPEARQTNSVKAQRASWAYWLVGSGLGGLVVGLILSSIAAVT